MAHNLTMSRYDNNGGSNDGDYDEDISLKLQNYAALRLDLTEVRANVHDQYGASIIPAFEATEIIDGVVFQREDKSGTWKVFSSGKFFNLNPEDGLIYENYDESEDEYSNEMSAQDILDHSRVDGFSENFGGDDYFYKSVGVVVEEADDIALNDDLVYDQEDFAGEDEDEPAGGLSEEAASTARSENVIPVGEASMMLGNNSWVRTFAKKVTQMGDAVIRDNGEDPTPRGEEEVNPKYDDTEWLATEEPELRESLEGRTLELWITEETNEFEDGEQTYDTPNLLDVKTDEFVTIDNDDADEGASADADGEKAAATDGGTVAESPDSTATESPDEPSVDDQPAAPDGLPENLIDYMANKEGERTAEEMREFSEDEVDNPDEIDWEAAAEVANEREV